MASWAFKSNFFFLPGESNRYSLPCACSAPSSAQATMMGSDTGGCLVGDLLTWAKVSLSQSVAPDAAAGELRGQQLSGDVCATCRGRGAPLARAIRRA